MEVCEKGITAIRAYFFEHPTESKSDSKSEAKTMQPVAPEEAVNGVLPSYDETVNGALFIYLIGCTRLLGLLCHVQFL
jgi:hypothetical protein